MARAIYVCSEEGHNKYWIIDRDPTNPAIVLVKNGRLGSPKGTIQPPKDCGSEWSADRYIENKIDEKLRKGYRKIDENKFKQLTMQASVIGLNNKCDLMQWVEQIPSDDQHYNFRNVGESRLMQPDYNPALLVSLTTKKAYAGQNSFRFLFTPDKSYEVRGYGVRGGVHQFEVREITKSDPLYDISSKVEAGMATVFG